MTAQTREEKLKSIYFTRPAANISSKVNLCSISPGKGFSNPPPRKKIKHPPSKLKSIYFTQPVANVSSKVNLCSISPGIRFSNKKIKHPPSKLNQPILHSLRQGHSLVILYIKHLDQSSNIFPKQIK